MMKKRLAATGLLMLAGAGILGARGGDTGIDSVVISALDGKLTVTVREGDKSRVIEIAKQSDGSFFFKEPDGSAWHASNLEMRLFSQKKAAEEAASHEGEAKEVLTLPLENLPNPE